MFHVCLLVFLTLDSPYSSEACIVFSRNGKAHFHYGNYLHSDKCSYFVYCPMPKLFIPLNLSSFLLSLSLQFFSSTCSVFQKARLPPRCLSYVASWCLLLYLSSLERLLSFVLIPIHNPTHSYLAIRVPIDPAFLSSASIFIPGQFNI